VQLQPTYRLSIIIYVLSIQVTISGNYNQFASILKLPADIKDTFIVESNNKANLMAIYFN